MKNKKTLAISVVMLLLSLLLSSCSGADGVGSGGGYYGDADPGYKGETGVTGEAPSDGTDDTPDSSEGETDDSEAKDEVDEPEQVTKPAGLITAGAWNDNDNYDDFKALFEQGATNGKFYYCDTVWGFTSQQRIKVTVKNGEAPVAGAVVTAKDADGNTLFSAVSNAAGVAYLFTNETSGTVNVSSETYSASAEFTNEQRELEVTLDGSAEKKNIIDIMFVVDITGSMGDELNFLQNEIDDVITKVVAKNEGAVINLALLFYRDSVDKDEFVYFDFLNVNNADNLATQKAALNAQYASGGGDYPESVDEALELAMSKQWSSAATTKLIFHILDAPPHSENSDKVRYNNAIKAAAQKGIRVCPILCSGADALTEYLTRQAAIYTGGTFIFITDDSGIGNPHHDPGIPNVTVEALNSLLVRVISGYHSGVFDAPVDWRQEVK